MMANRYASRPRAPSPPGNKLINPAGRSGGGSKSAAGRPNHHNNFSDSNYSFRLSENDEESDNTYSLVQDSVRKPGFSSNSNMKKSSQTPAAVAAASNYKTRIDRMFGDSANEDDHGKRPNGGGNKFGSVSSNSTTSSSIRGGSLASLYQARKQRVGAAGQQHDGRGTYDAATVEQIKAQFQAQIEAMMISQVLTIKT